MHELVIFECDGVLVDSEVISNVVLARMLTREGLPTTLSEARRDYQGALLSDVQSRAEAKLGRSLPPGWLAEYEHERALRDAGAEIIRSLDGLPKLLGLFPASTSARASGRTVDPSSGAGSS
jgi:beta-phosphoglucomutase-like phosphatase (HAD superfamily)